MPKKLDRRVQRTRKLLSESLLALMLEKGYDSITIQDITDHANLGRATFYLHYHDKDELLMSTLEAVVDDFISLIDPSKAPHDGRNPIPMMLALEHVAENADLYRALFRAQGAHGVIWRLQGYVADLLQSNIVPPAAATPSPPIPRALWSNYVAGAFLAQIRWWLENDMPHSPDYMVHVFMQLGLSGMFRAMGVDSAAIDSWMGLPLSPEAFEASQTLQSDNNTG